MVQVLMTSVILMVLHSGKLHLKVITGLYSFFRKMVQISTLILVSIKLHLIQLVPKVIKRLYGSCWIMEQMSMFKLSLAVHLKKLLGEVIRRLCSSCWIILLGHGANPEALAEERSEADFDLVRGFCPGGGGPEGML